MMAFRAAAPRLPRALAGVIAASMSCAASAAIITVGPHTDCLTNNLTAAMVVAKLNGTDFDEIRVVQGTYSNLALSSIGISYSLTGGYNHCGPDAIVVGRTHLSGNAFDSVLSIAGATNAYHNVTLSHLNISNGGASNRGNYDGGGIKASNLRLVLSDVDVINNDVSVNSFGGGIYISRDASAVSGILELQRNVRLAGNTAGDGGGLAAVRASVRIRPDGTVLENNQANLSGGGIWISDGDLTVGSFGEPEFSDTATGMIIRNNIATTSDAAKGGGLFASNSVVNLREVAFIGNRAKSGAGVSAIGGQLSIGRDSPGFHVGCPDALRCTRFEYNWVSDDCLDPAHAPDPYMAGGAIALLDTRAFIHQVEFMGNCAHRGAVLYARGETAPLHAVVMEGVLAYDNYNATGWVPSIDASAPLRVSYSTLVRSYMRPLGSTDWQTLFALGSSPSSGSYIRTSIVDDAFPSLWGTASANCSLHVPVNRSTFRDPDGGDFRLAATAVGAIDRCSADLVPIEYTDLERKPRCTDSPAHADGGGRCDIGALEYDSDPFGYGFGNDFE
jgi:hypothetical protein